MLSREELVFTPAEMNALCTASRSSGLPMKSVALSKAVWTGPVSNDGVTITFTQLVKDKDPLRTGTYTKTLTFTLSTTTP